MNSKLIYNIRIKSLLVYSSAILAVTLGGVLRFIKVGDHHNSYYTATVHSMLENFRNFAYGAFDPAGLVMVDKPPLAFWVQSIPASLLGTNGFSVSLTQSFLGTLAVAILYIVLSKNYGRIAGIAGAITLAILPASVVIDRGNEPDSLLSFILLLAAISIIRAVQTNNWKWLFIFGFLMGVAFNTKMLVAMVPLPALLFYFLLANRHQLRQFLIKGMFLTLILIITAGSWITFVALSPPAERPYVGSTANNSIVTLVLEHNGLNRFTSFIGPRSQQGIPPSVRPSRQQFNGFSQLNNPRPPSQSRPLSVQPNQAQSRDFRQFQPQIPKPQNSLGSPFLDKPILRLFSEPLAPQLGWLLPIGGFLSIASIILFIRKTRKISKSEFSNPSLETDSNQEILWSGWLLLGLLVFGVANSTTTHPYYLAGLAVPLAATIGIGTARASQMLFYKNPVSLVIPAIVIAGIVYQVYGTHGTINQFVWTAALALGITSSLILAIYLRRKTTPGKTVKWSLAVGVMSLLLIPTTISISAEGKSLNGFNRPAIQIPYPGNRPPQPGLPSSEQFKILEYYLIQQKTDTKIILGTVNARDASPYIISGIPTIAIGGFSGNDPILTVDSFNSMARLNGPNYFLMPKENSQGDRRGSNQTPILEYIQDNWTDISDSLNLPRGTLFQKYE
jgi:4-amino-4-deoxy-L-arabinose transferase-like glycosyltransferase